MSISIVFEGQGNLDLQLWNTAIAKAAEKHPGSRLVKRGHLGLSQWVDTGIAPTARLVNFSHWNGKTSEGAAVFTLPMDITRGPTFEIILLEGNPNRVCFRSHHATMDAAGILIFAKDVFRALRDEPVIGSNSTLTDIEFIQNLNDRPQWPAKKELAVAATGLPKGDDLDCTWQLIRAQGKQNDLVARLTLATRKSTMRYKDHDPSLFADPVTRSRITVNLRRHLTEDVVSTANLSSAFDVDIDNQDVPETITKKIMSSLNNRLECALPSSLMLSLAPWVPTKLTGLSDKSILSVHKKGQYSRSGTLSNIGLIRRKEFSGGGFNTISAFTIPPLFKLSPYFITAMGDDDGCNVLVCVPNCLGNDGRLEQLTADIKEALS